MKPAYDDLLLRTTWNSFLYQTKCKYLDFRWFGWRKVGEQGYMISSYDTQPYFNGEGDLMVTLDSKAISACTDILTTTPWHYSPTTRNKLHYVTHNCTCNIWPSTVTNLRGKKKTHPNTFHHVTWEDAVPFRMCGAKVARTLKCRRKRKLEQNVDKSHQKNSIAWSANWYTTQNVHSQWIQGHRDTKASSVLATITYVQVPNPNPMEVVLLFRLFTQQQNCPLSELEEVHNELVTKMFNLRKEDWNWSFERAHLDRKGKPRQLH